MRCVVATQLLTVGLTNVAIASALAAVIGLGLRWRSNAHLAAVLWMIVLLRFIMPPLLSLPIELATADQPPTRIQERRPRANVMRGAEFRRPLLPTDTPSGPSQTAESTSIGQTESSETVRRRLLPSKPVSEPSAHRPGVSPSASRLRRLSSVLWHPSWWVSLWLAGAAVTLTRLVANGARFQRLICQVPRSREGARLTEMLQQLCTRLDVRKVPRLRVVDSRISPLLWTWWNGVTLIVPRSLISSLPSGQQEMLLSHELAHLLRHDHLSRWLEATVQSLYWWLPVVPWVRRQLHAAQEECCDAFVQRHFPQQQLAYCDTLLAASSLLQHARRAPLWASELGSRSDLKRRIQTMLEQKLSPQVPRRTLATCVLLGLSVCAMSFRWVNAQPATEIDQQSDRRVKPVEQPAGPERDAVESWFVITDEQGASVQSGKAHLRGYYDNGDYFERELAIEAGNATFPFKRPRLRELSVSIRSAGYQSHSRKYEVDGTDRGFKVAKRYTFQLKPGIMIGGNVVDEAGRPLQGVHVFLDSPSTTREDGSRDFAEYWFQTDAEGRWSCPGIAPDVSNIGLRLEHATHVHESSITRSPFYMPVEAAELDGLRTRTDVRVMHEDPPLVGRIVDPDGNAISNVTVDISGHETDWYQHYARGLVIKTNAAGEFRLPRPPHGDQRLTVSHPDWLQQQFPVAVPLEKPLTVTLRKGKRIEFRVTDTHGKPIEGIRFLPDYAGADLPNGGKTDEDGRLVWENAPDEVVRYQIVSSKYLCQPPGSEYKPQDSPVTLTFRSNLPVIGTVVDAETGAPIPEFRLYKGTHFKANRPDFWSWWMETSQTMRPVKGSWAEGQVDARSGTPMEPGQFGNKLYALDRVIRYRIQADGYLPQLSEPLDAAALPDEPVRLEFRLKKNSNVERTVLSPDGPPAAGARIFTQVRRGNDNAALILSNGVPKNEPSEYTPAAVLRADGAGQFELPVYNDPFVCVITHETGFLELGDRALIEQSDVTLEPWTAIDGTVFAQGEPAPDADISLSFQPDRSMLEDTAEIPMTYYRVSATTDNAGRYRLPFGMPGVWHVAVSYSSADDEADSTPGSHRPAAWRSTTFTIDVPRENTTRLDIGREGVDVIGRVIVPEGVEVDWPFSGVHFVREVSRQANGFSRREFHQARLSPDGTFRCFNLRPGDYEGAAIAGTADARIWAIYAATRKKSFEKSLRLTPEMFVGKSSTKPIDVGEIVLDPVNR